MYTEYVVADLMTIDPVSVAPTASVDDAASVMETCDVTGLPVVDEDGNVVGVISQTDLFRDGTNLARLTGKEIRRLRVADLMSSPAITAGAYAPLVDAASLMDCWSAERPERVNIRKCRSASPPSPSPSCLIPFATAVIAVDLQNDFGAAGGYVDSFGVPLEGVRATIEPIARVLEVARAAQLPVVYTKVEYKRDLSNLGAADSPNRKRLGLGAGDFLIEGTWNTEIVPELAPEPGDIVVSKQRYSGFFETDLDDVLRARGITSLVFVGWTTSVCVESTLRDASYRDYRCLVLSDCTSETIGRSQVRTNHEASLYVIQAQFGWVTESESLIEGLTGATIDSAAG